MVDQRQKIRECLQEKLVSKQSGRRNPRRFATDKDLDIAVEAVLKRMEQISTLSSKLGSPAGAISYLRERANRQKLRVFSQNYVPFSSMVFQTTSLGLCPLPNRLDCLTALSTKYPNVVSESNLTITEVFSERVMANWREQEEIPEGSIAVKRCKIKY